MAHLRTLWLLVASCWALGPVAAMDRTTADTLVAQAVQRYAEGDVVGALTLFDSVAGHWNSAGLQYNIGNCHYRAGDIGRAILHYERALRLAPGAADVRANLELARQQVVDRVPELPAFSLSATWGLLRGGRDADQWARRCMVVSPLFFLVLALAMVVRGRGAALGLKVLAGLLGAALLVCIAFAAARHAELQDHSAAIVLAPKVDVRSEPGEGATLLFVLHRGTKVTVLQERLGWYEVRLANGNIGWMPPAAAERI